MSRALEEAAAELRKAVTNEFPEAITVEGRKVVLRMCSTTASFICQDIRVSKESTLAAEVHAVDILRQFLHWYDADRPEDKIGYDSAHFLGGTVGQARAVVGHFDRLKAKEAEK